MLRLLEGREGERLAQWAWELTGDVSRVSFPLYCDGSKDREDFLRQARQCMAEDWGEALLYERDGRADGWLQTDYLAADGYLSTSFLLTGAQPGALDALEAYVSARYPGVDWHMGVPEENAEATAWLQGHGFTLEEASEVWSLDCREAAPPIPQNVTRVTREGFDAFRRLHDGIDMY
ncbi:MAG: hypothetical protein ACI4OY_00175 [Aristaeellaceae bacterium]